MENYKALPHAEKALSMGTKAWKRSNDIFFSNLLATLPDGRVADVSIGLHWTAEVLDVDGELRCGLASTMRCVHQNGIPDVPQAGTLENLTGLALAEFTQTEQPTLMSVGMAAVNALLPRRPDSWVDLNAEDVII
jgi:uncharacterized protein (DUF4213/DUF364 family)